MPVVARVGGVAIAIFANDHPPPHFHAFSAEHRAVIDIASLTVRDGYLPMAEKRRVLTWAGSRRDLLVDRFLRAVAHERVEPIP